MTARIRHGSVLSVAIVIVVLGRGQLGFGDEPFRTVRPELESRVDELFAKWNRSESPGCAVGIIERGQLIYSKGIGSANLEYRAGLHISKTAQQGR